MNKDNDKNKMNADEAPMNPENGNAVWRCLSNKSQRFYCESSAFTVKIDFKCQRLAPGGATGADAHKIPMHKLHSWFVAQSFRMGILYIDSL